MKNFRISISSLAWAKTEEKKVFDTLNKNNINLIDIVPNKYFESCFDLNLLEVKEFKNYLKKYNISPYGMQSLFYEIKDLNLFKNEEERNQIIKYFKNISVIADLLDIRKLVFGSPKTRYKINNNFSSQNIEIEFFLNLGEIANKYNLTICLEPAPIIYGCNFLNNTDETIEFIKLLKHPNIKLQFDSGSIKINKEKPIEIIKKFNDLIGHIHLSNPYLKPLIKEKNHNKVFFKSLTNINSLDVVTIEMLTSNKEKCIREIDESIKFVRNLSLDL